jgi:hypothetical protein
MKKCFIGMSINKQLYIGIYGISVLIGVLSLILIALASIKLFFNYNDRIKSIFNEMDTTIAALNAENGDLFGQLLFEQGKFESFLVRKYFNNLIDDFEKELVENILIEEDEINNHFILYNENKAECETDDSKCYFIYSDNSELIKSQTKRILFLLIPTLDMSLDIRAYNKDNFLIFNKFNFYENKAYFIYKYNKTENVTSFFGKVKPVGLISNTLME